MKKLIVSSTLLLSIFNPLNTQAQTAGFSDIYSEHVNRDAIEYLQEKEIIEGYSDGQYKAENRINRAEFVKILIESQIQNPSGSFCFDDVNDEWFAPYVCTAKRLGYIEGYSDNTFKPGQYINFAEASKIITKVLKIEPDLEGTNGEWYAGFVNSLAEKKAIPTTIQFFDRDISRGEMAEIIWRIKAEVTSKVSQDYETISEPLPYIKSCEVLRDKFNTYQSYEYRGGFIEDDIMFMEGVDFDRADDAEVSAPSANKAATGSSSDSNAAEEFSTTNIQVEGVDEADIIKNDGKFIYLIKNNTIRIVQAFPANEMKEVANLTFEEDNFRPNEMFLNGDQLVVIGNSWGYYDSVVKSLIAPPRYGNNRTKVIIFDITDRSKPTEERTLRFEGNYHTSRRIDNRMLLVMNQHPNFWALNEINDGEDLIPLFADGEGKDELMADCGDIRYFPGHGVPNYLIVASVPLDDMDGEINREIFLGSSDNVYSSLENLYVATNQVNYNYYTDWDWREDRAHTLVFKFNLNDDGTVEYQDRGRVAGRILNQFSMDEYKDHFRIATTIDSWNSDNPSTNQVYVMSSDMEVVGDIDNIAPGERIYSTRFLGDRLYMVTFRQVDPLFVITLKDPKNPRILGQLKIPGFSDYLHPFDENHIIGFGKETEETKTGAVLMKGFKMALFDVSNVSSPVQKFVEVIGDRGTDSELLRNHKALLFDKEKELLAFPINIIEKINLGELECSKYRYDSCPSLCQQRCIPSSCSEDEEGRSVCTDDCNGLGSCQEPEYERYNTTFSGAVVYTLNADDGFEQRGKISHYDEIDLLKMGDYWPYNYEKNIQRIIYIGKNLFTISQDRVKANDINTIEEVNEVKLNDEL